LEIDFIDKAYRSVEYTILVNVYEKMLSIQFLQGKVATQCSSLSQGLSPTTKVKKYYQNRTCTRLPKLSYQ